MYNGMKLNEVISFNKDIANEKEKIKMMKKEEQKYRELAEISKANFDMENEQKKRNEERFQKVKQFKENYQLVSQQMDDKNYRKNRLIRNIEEDDKFKVGYINKSPKNSNANTPIEPLPAVKFGKKQAPTRVFQNSYNILNPNDEISKTPNLRNKSPKDSNQEEYERLMKEYVGNQQTYKQMIAGGKSSSDAKGPTNTKENIFGNEINKSSIETSLSKYQSDYGNSSSSKNLKIVPINEENATKKIAQRPYSHIANNVYNSYNNSYERYNQKPQAIQTDYTLNDNQGEFSSVPNHDPLSFNYENSGNVLNPIEAVKKDLESQVRGNVNPSSNSHDIGVGVGGIGIGNNQQSTHVNNYNIYNREIAKMNNFRNYSGLGDYDQNYKNKQFDQKNIYREFLSKQMQDKREVGLKNNIELNPYGGNKRYDFGQSSLLSNIVSGDNMAPNKSLDMGNAKISKFGAYGNSIMRK